MSKHAERPREPTDCPTGRGSHVTPGPGPEERCTTAGGRASVGDVDYTETDLCPRALCAIDLVFPLLMF